MSQERGAGKNAKLVPGRIKDSNNDDDDDDDDHKADTRGNVFSHALCFIPRSLVLSLPQ